MKNFANKIVVITGAGSGIGRALALAFGKLGAKLVLNDYSETTLNETLEKLRALNYSCIHHAVFDVSDEAAMFGFAADIKRDHGKASVVINNAGIAGSAELSVNTPIDIYRRVMDINFYGMLYGCKAFMDQLLENEEGAIVNMSSIYGLMGVPRNTDYCASKFAVRGYTEALSVELYQSPVSVHCVHPGGIKTNILSSLPGNKQLGKFKDRFLTTPPEDLAARIIKGIVKNEPRIVYGNQSFGAWLGSRLLSKRSQDKILWKRFRKILVDKPANR
ncbi:SDR family NAD(P)-dependent oxidoreductase [Flavilitoribacter nigricans]|nr:SDR family oxidoreductase [Flavilitoribacter nigricans]